MPDAPALGQNITGAQPIFSTNPTDRFISSKKDKEHLAWSFENGWKLLEIAEIGQKLAGISQKWVEMSGKGVKQLEMDGKGNARNWLVIARNGLK